MPSSAVISDVQIAALRTIQGVQIGQFGPGEIITCSWSREKSEVSRCELTVPRVDGPGGHPLVQPWLHWISVWDGSGQEMYWDGPVRKVTVNADTMTLECRDLAALHTRTRSPLTKKWDKASPVDIAEEVVHGLIEHHGLRVAPITRPDPWIDRYDYTTTSDSQMVEAVMNDLTQMGLTWSVVSGIPILGPMSRTPLAALGEDDFAGGGLTLVRDGEDTYNDVLLRGADTLTIARTPMAGLSLQTIVSIDSMFGVSNVDKAARQYAGYSAKIHDKLVLPDSAVLHPHAPVRIGQLIPTTRFTVTAYGATWLMQLTGVDVSYTPGTSSVSVRMEVVDDELPELVEIKKHPYQGGTKGSKDLSAS